MINNIICSLEEDKYHTIIFLAAENTLINSSTKSYYNTNIVKNLF